MSVRVKICGLTTIEAVEAAKDADFGGFVFYPPSPRHVTPEQAAELARHLNPPAVAVTVDADDALLNAIVATLKPAWLQLHGKESVERAGYIKACYGIPIIKAISVSSQNDVIQAHDYVESADMLLFDAKVPKGLPGGNGITFDWKLLAGSRFVKPWFLSGGITLDNLDEAVRASGAAYIDVSSSLESSPGTKNPALVNKIITKLKSNL